MSMLTIGELARRVGLRTSALRYYEKEGLLEPTERSEAGYRLYAPEAEETLRAQKDAVLERYAQEVEALYDHLSSGRSRVGFSTAFLDILARDLDLGRLAGEHTLANASPVLRPAAGIEQGVDRNYGPGKLGRG